MIDTNSEEEIPGFDSQDSIKRSKQVIFVSNSENPQIKNNLRRTVVGSRNGKTID